MRISNDLEAILGQPTMQMNGSLKHSLYTKVKMCFPEISPICLNFAFRGWKKDVYTYSRNTRRQEIVSHSFFQRPALYNWTVITNNHHQVPTPGPYTKSLLRFLNRKRGWWFHTTLKEPSCYLVSNTEPLLCTCFYLENKILKLKCSRSTTILPDISSIFLLKTRVNQIW